MLALFMIAKGVIIIFSIIFLFYTNSFLIKRRKKEMGLLIILGMEKKHVGIMLFYESVITAISSILAGLAGGLVFSKMLFLLLTKLIDYKGTIEFDIHLNVVCETVIFFMCIFVVTYVYNLIRTRLTNPIELLHGGETGEKEPKTKLLLTIIGIACIGAGYYYALFTESPMEALNLFFGAVILVMIGTYALFTAGSITLLKLLKMNKKYYYKAKHFSVVSGMLYRMKQNAVGLSNICILATMVLITFSTTISMYAGAEDGAYMSCPADAIYQIRSNVNELDNPQAVIDDYVAATKDIISQYDIDMNNVKAFHNIQLIGQKADNENRYIFGANQSISNISNVKIMIITTAEEYNENYGTNYSINDNEVYILGDTSRGDGSISFDFTDCGANIVKYNIIGTDSELPIWAKQTKAMADTQVILVRDMKQIIELYKKNFDDSSRIKNNLYYEVMVDARLNQDKYTAIYDKLKQVDATSRTMVSYDTLEESRYEYRCLYGGFLFIGVFLGILFMMATVLIIYYKQISEGFDDRERFQIMKKVGMSNDEVHNTIRSQVLTVFYLPITVAVLHVLVSFRIIKMILAMMGLTNSGLFFISTLAAVVVFAIVYFIVYSITARTYYKIVNEADIK